MRCAVITEIELGVSMIGVSVLVPVALRPATKPLTGPVARSTRGGAGSGCGAVAIGACRLRGACFLACVFAGFAETGGRMNPGDGTALGVYDDCDRARSAQRPLPADTHNAATTTSARRRFDIRRSAFIPHTTMPPPQLTLITGWLAVACLLPRA